MLVPCGQLASNALCFGCSHNRNCEVPRLTHSEVFSDFVRFCPSAGGWPRIARDCRSCDGVLNSSGLAMRSILEDAEQKNRPTESACWSKSFVARF